MRVQSVKPFIAWTLLSATTCLALGMLLASIAVRQPHGSKLTAIFAGIAMGLIGLAAGLMAFMGWRSARGN